MEERIEKIESSIEDIKLYIETMEHGKNFKEVIQGIKQFKEENKKSY